MATTKKKVQQAHAVQSEKKKAPKPSSFDKMIKKALEHNPKKEKK